MESKQIRKLKCQGSHAANRIPDPFLGFNELKAEWVADQAWTYKVTLPKAEETKHTTVHVLAFDGLDTFATVRLNEEVILQSDNMFIPHRVDVTEKLQSQAENILEIDFKSARLEAIKIREAHPEHTWVGFNGDMSRLAVRKAQYHWGWDWGPYTKHMRTVARSKARDISSSCGRREAGLPTRR